MSLGLVGKIDFRQIEDDRGSITPIEFPRDIPFPIERVYYLYGVPANGERGGHAHRDLRQILIAVAGSFDVVLNDGKSTLTQRLDCPASGLLIPQMVWRELKNFSEGAVCLVLASAMYAEDDYIRDFSEFMRVANP